MSTRPVFLVGGTGDVGTTLARHLAGSGDRHIVLCSRNPDEVWDLAREIGAETLAIDAADKSYAGLISAHGILVNLTEATTPEFIEACMTALVLAHTVEALAAWGGQGIVPITDLMSANDDLAAIQEEFPETILEEVQTVELSPQPAQPSRGAP